MRVTTLTKWAFVFAHCDVYCNPTAGTGLWDESHFATFRYQQVAVIFKSFVWILYRYY